MNKRILRAAFVALALATGSSAAQESPSIADKAFWNDHWITTKVSSKLQFNKDLWRTGIDVETKAGVVTLNGNVATKALVGEAGRLAQSIEGVKSVRNNLKVGPPTVRSDAAQVSPP